MSLTLTPNPCLSRSLAKSMGFTCMRNSDQHGAIIEADIALRIACVLPPPPLSFRLVEYCNRRNFRTRKNFVL